MPVLSVDMTGVDAEESLQSDFNPAPPGVHKAKIISCEPATSSKGNQMLEVVMRPMAPNGQTYSQVWYYLTFGDNAFTKKKLDQFLLAIGVLTKSKRKAKFNTDVAVGKIVKVNIRAKRSDANTPEQYRNQYQPEVADVLPNTDDEDFDGNADGELDTDFEEPTADQLDTGSEEGAEEEEGLYSLAEMDEMTVDDIKTILAEDYEITSRLKSKDKLLEKLKAAQAEYCKEQGLTDPAVASDEDEEDFEDDEDEEDEEEPKDGYTEEDLKTKTAPELKAIAKEVDADITGMKVKSKVIAAILEAQDEEPF